LQNVRGIAVFFVVVLSVSACTSGVVISDRFIVDRTVMLTDATGMPTPNDALSETMLGKGSQKGGMMLRPGDVLHIAYWSSSMVGLGPGLSQRHGGAPTVHKIRLPLRKLFDSKTTGEDRAVKFTQLNDTERMFLANILVTNRAKIFGPESAKEWVKNTLWKHEITIWNKLIDTMRIRRLDAEGVNEYCESIGTSDDTKMCHLSTSLVSLTFSLMDLASELPESDSTSFLSAFKPCLTTKNKKCSSGNKPNVVDIAGLSDTAATPYTVMAKGSNNGVRTHGYYDKNINFMRTMINFVTVEVNGVDFRSPQLLERGWSLRSVEDSGICGKNSKISEFTFTQGGTYAVVEDNAQATYKISRFNIDSSSDGRPNRVGTEVRPKAEGLKQFFGRFINGTSVHRYDLENIYIADVKQIVWRGISMDEKDARFRAARCLMKPSH